MQASNTKQQRENESDIGILRLRLLRLFPIVMEHGGSKFQKQHFRKAAVGYIGDISAPRDTKWQKSNFECGTISRRKSGCTLSGKDKRLFGKSHSEIEVSTSNYRKVIHEAQNALLRPEFRIQLWSRLCADDFQVF
jgi:hypothetical protein